MNKILSFVIGILVAAGMLTPLAFGHPPISRTEMGGAVARVTPTPTRVMTATRTRTVVNYAATGTAWCGEFQRQFVGTPCPSGGPGRQKDRWVR